MKHLDRHPVEVEGCFGCKILGIGFGSVPGGTRAGSFRKAHERKFQEDMDSYHRARKAGENPHQISKESVRKHRQQVESVQRARKKLEAFDIDTSHIKTGIADG